MRCPAATVRGGCCKTAHAGRRLPGRCGSGHRIGRGGAARNRTRALRSLADGASSAPADRTRGGADVLQRAGAVSRTDLAGRPGRPVRAVSAHGRHDARNRRSARRPLAGPDPEGADHLGHRQAGGRTVERASRRSSRRRRSCELTTRSSVGGHTNRHIFDAERVDHHRAGPAASRGHGATDSGQPAHEKDMPCRHRTTRLGVPPAVHAATGTSAVRTGPRHRARVR